MEEQLWICPKWKECSYPEYICNHRKPHEINKAYGQHSELWVKCHGSCIPIHEVRYGRMTREYGKKMSEEKYKLLKPITLQAILDAGAQPTCPTFQSFADNVFKAGIGPNEQISMEDALKWRKTEFLFNKGFIRKVEEVFYKVGNHFEIDERYVLAWVPQANYPHDVVMINLATGWNTGIKNVSDGYKIPKSEFDKVFPGFTKIEE